MAKQNKLKNFKKKPEDDHSMDNEKGVGDKTECLTS